MTSRNRVLIVDELWPLSQAMHLAAGLRGIATSILGLPHRLQTPLMKSP